MSGALRSVCANRLHLETDAANPHPVVKREVGERDAHPLLMELADVVLDVLGFDASEFLQLAERVHTLASLERREDVLGERVELLQDHRGGDGLERGVGRGVGGGLLLGGVVAHGEFVIGRCAGLTQVDLVVVSVDGFVALVLLADVAAVAAHLFLVATRTGAAQEESVAVILTRGRESASAETLEDTIGGGSRIGRHGIDASRVSSRGQRRSPTHRGGR